MVWKTTIGSEANKKNIYYLFFACYGSSRDNGVEQKQK